jgi:DNA mismatch endonuclease, patch repair protein
MPKPSYRIRMGGPHILVEAARRDRISRIQRGDLVTDTISAAERSALMSRIRSKDTSPERAVRSILHRLGFRFRLHRSDLPGCPDIVLPRHRKIVLVHGCFWHGHTCRLASKPKSNKQYWREKIRSNCVRDRRNHQLLNAQGWTVLELWECEIRAITGVSEKLQAFMQN